MIVSNRGVVAASVVGGVIIVAGSKRCRHHVLKNILFFSAVFVLFHLLIPLCINFCGH